MTDVAISTVSDPIRVGSRWVFSDGTTLPVVAGGDGPTVAVPTIPEDLTALDDDALAALLADLESTFDRLHDEGSRDLALLTSLAEAVEAANAETQRRETEAANLDEELEALAQRVHPAAETDTGDDTGDDADDDDDDADDDADTTADDAAPVAVTAAGTRPALGSIARRAPRNRPTRTRQPVVTITAAADLPGVSPGTHMDVDRLGVAMHERVRLMPRDSTQRAPIAQISVPYAPDQWLVSDQTENARRIRNIVGQPEAAALVASGGWCAPSQPIFTLFDVGPDTEGLFDLPGIGSNVRAGVMVPAYYGIGDVAGALWTWTEANDIDAADNDGSAGDKVKPCLKIPCPAWTECRMEAEGLCVTHGNLSDRAWPELTRYFVGIVVAAHAHRISAAKIAKVAASATAVTPDVSMLNSDAAGDLLGILELQAADIRSQYRLGRRRSVDVVLPDWTTPVLRANMAKRAGVDFMNVSDAQAVGWLTSRGIRPQFASDYQPLYATGAATKWPANIEFLMFISGAYVAIDGGTIDLGVVRDSTLNATNDFTAAWSEQFFQVCNIGPKARKVTVPLTVDGVTACCAAP